MDEIGLLKFSHRTVSFYVSFADCLFTVGDKWRMWASRVQSLGLWYHHTGQGEISWCYLQEHAVLSATVCSRPRSR